MLLRRGTAEMLHFYVMRYLCLGFSESGCQTPHFDYSYGIIWGMINPFLPSISESLMSGPRSGKNALTMSLLEKTAVTSTHRTPPFGYPTASS